MWNADRPEMGCHVDIGGTALRNIVEQQNVDQKALLVEICNAGGKFSRLDIAKDLRGQQNDLKAVYASFEKKEHTGTARKIREWHDTDGGQTIYIGSPKSDKQVRVYDKANEQGLKNEYWYRLELQCRRLVARSTAYHLAQQDNWGAVMDNVVLHMVDLPHVDAWKAFFSDNNPEIGTPLLEKQTDREKWIMTQVLPAVAKHYTENLNSPAVALLRQLLDKIENNQHTHD